MFVICDRVMVLRDGRAIETRATSAWTTDALVAAMVNRPMSEVFPERETPLGDVRLDVRGLASEQRFSDVSFNVRAGEIVGLAGLVGAGRTEVAKTIFGALPRTAGEVSIDGRTLSIKNPQSALRAGIVLVPEDRKLEGLVLDFPIRQNIVLSIVAQRRCSARSSTAASRTRRRPTRCRRCASARAGSCRLVRRLSGGNQQKVVLGRALTLKPRVLILDEPTRGIDVGAKVEVYRIIRRLASEGAAILIVSSGFWSSSACATGSR